VQFPRRKNFMEEVFSVLTQENTKNDSAATTLPGEKTGSSAHGFNRFSMPGFSGEEERLESLRWEEGYCFGIREARFTPV
jgi:hypothetical protein